MAYRVFLDRELGCGFELYGSYPTLDEAISEGCFAGTSVKCARYILTPMGQEIDPFNAHIQRAARAA